MQLILCLALHCIFAATAEGALKSWQADSNYDNANNWSPTRTPCHKDYVHFSSNEEAVVYLTTRTEFTEMLLPMNGEFIFGENVQIGMTDSERQCDSSVMKYLGAGARNWYDAENWFLIQSDYLMNYDYMAHQLPVPHADRVPCEGDNVVFQPEKSFRVDMATDTVIIQSISINGQVMDRQSLEEIIQNSTNMVFERKGRIVLQNFTCDDISGCTCSNNKPQILSHICSNMSPRCQALECADPIRPDGHCCQMCGSVMRLDYGDMFNLNLLKSLVDVFLAKEEFSQVTAYLSKTASNKIQAVILDTTESRGSAVRLVQDLTNELQRDRANVNLYDVIHIDSKNTQHWIKIEPGALNSGFGAGSVFGILLGIFFLLFLPVGLFIVYKKHKSTGFSFARFDANRGKVELELGTTPHEALDPPTEEFRKGFDNPMYGSSSKKASSRGGRQSYVQEIRVNPVYKDEEKTILSPYDDD